MRKIYQLNELKMIISEKKLLGKKIVCINGCFDIIHVGHLNYIQEAKKEGDLLIVLLNSDSSIKKIKSNKPINNQELRSKFLEKIYEIDYVILFDEERITNLILDIHPDIYVKPDIDKNDEEIEKIKNHDISIKLIEKKINISTSHICNKVIDVYKKKNSYNKLHEYYTHAQNQLQEIRESEYKFLNFFILFTTFSFTAIANLVDIESLKENISIFILISIVALAHLLITILLINKINSNNKTYRNIAKNIVVIWENYDFFPGFLDEGSKKFGQGKGGNNTRHIMFVLGLLHFLFNVIILISTI